MHQPVKLFIVLSALVLVSGFATWYWSAGDATCPLNVVLEPEARTVILRLDDVQAGYLTELSMRMMDDAISRQLPLSAGLIPYGISGDAVLTSYLRKHECEVEGAMHGLDHKLIVVDGVEHGEYALLDRSAARERTVEALEAFNTASLKKPITFIPPHNELTVEGREALVSLGLPIISSLGQSRYDFDAGTWDYATSTFVGAAAVIEACERDFAAGGAPCVVMLHPQDFIHADKSVDEEKYREYLILLDTLANGDFVVTRFDWHYRQTVATDN